MNVKTGSIESLIEGSAQNLPCQQAAYIVARSNQSFELHLCITDQNDELVYENSWYRMVFLADFIKTLGKYWHLPISSPEETLEVLQQSEHQQKVIQKLLLQERKKAKYWKEHTETYVEGFTVEMIRSDTMTMEQLRERTL